MEFNSVDEIYTTIEITRGKLVAAVSELSNDNGRYLPAPEKWSVAHAVEHLAKTEVNLVRVIEKLLGEAEAANKPSDGHIAPPVSFVDIAQQWQGQKLQAPEFIKPEGAATIAESLAQLEQSRQKLRDLRPRIEQIDLSEAKYPHPAFGPINGYYWLAFIGFHESRHLKQINEILAHRETVLNS